jgi:Histidine kinase-, DNA gyrase B-, and HSP90-like ATPase
VSSRVDPSLLTGAAGAFKPVAVRHAHADPETVTEFVSRIGYQLPIALADLIDNAIDAGATRVHVGLILQDDRPAAIAIADNGCGMHEDELERAVSLEKDPAKQQGKSLGRYGAGLKAASFSLGRVLTIATKKRGGPCLGARLDSGAYKSDYQYGVLSEPASALILEADWGTRRLGPSGTVLLISDLSSMIPKSNSSQDLFLRDFGREVDTRLGMVFHRYLESGRLTITKGSRASDAFTSEFGVYALAPVNPFGYPASGYKGYPVTLTFHVADLDVPVTLHLWPKQGRTKASRDKNYDILGRSGEWQGFYFYRWDRVLQAGGWNGVFSQEPHSSYARIEIDLPPGSDNDFRPTVMKDRIENPRPLIEQLTVRPEWTEYISAARRVYRGLANDEQKKVKRPPAEKSSAPVVRTAFVKLRRDVSLRRGRNGRIEINRRIIDRLGRTRSDAIAELVRQAATPIVRRKRLSADMKRDWEELDDAVWALIEGND